jgi:large subunit ribosomal protein L18
MKKVQIDRKARKKRRVSSNIHGTTERPRVAVHRTNRYIYVQAIDDVKRETIVSYSSLLLQKTHKDASTKVNDAKMVGQKVGELLKEKGINEAVFDRSYFIYRGRVKSLCEGVREAGIKI